MCAGISLGGEAARRYYRLPATKRATVLDIMDELRRNPDLGTLDEANGLRVYRRDGIHLGYEVQDSPGGGEVRGMILYTDRDLAEL